MTHRRTFLRFTASGAALIAGAMALPVVAQGTWPNRPIRIVVPYAAGQGADVLTRLIANELQKMLGQPIVVENRAGAGGNIGAAAVANAPPDGYTFLLGTNATNAANEFLYSGLGFNPASDFESVGMIGLLPMVISTSLPDLQTNSIAELIARARAKPSSLDVALPSTTAQVVFAQFTKQAQAPMFGVKYKASGQAITDVLGGQVRFVIDTVTATRPHVAAGKLHALGITSLKASDMLPGVKPIAEQGVPGFDVVAWDAFFAPHGVPPEIISKFTESLNVVLQDPAVRQKLMDVGVEPRYMSPSKLAEFVRSERTKWGAVIQSEGIRSE